MLGFLNNFWSPGFGTAEFTLAVFAIGLILAFAIGSVSWWTASGTASDGERAFFGPAKFLPTSGKKVGVWVLTVVGLGVPFVLWLGTLLQVFPYSEQSDLLLISREVSSIAFDDPAFKQWTAFVIKPPHRRMIDVGKIVDNVLGRIAGAARPPLEPTNQSLNVLAEKIVREEVAKTDFHSLAIADPSLLRPRPFVADAIAPPWLVESVEIAVLRLSVERINTGRIAVLAAGRRDQNAQPTWSDVEPYLRAVDRVQAPPEQIQIFESDIDNLAPRLITASSATTASGEATLLLSYAVPAATSKVSNDRLVIRAGPMPTDTVISDRTITRQHGVAVQRLPIQLGRGPKIPDEIRSEHPSSGHFSVVPMRSMLTGWTHLLRITGPDQWNDTYRALDGNSPDGAGPAAAWWFRFAHERLLGKDGPLEGVKLAWRGTPNAGDIIIDGGSINNGILIYIYNPNHPFPLNDIRSEGAPSEKADVIAWSRAVAQDSLFDLPALELPGTPGSGLATPQPIAQVYLAALRPQRLNDGLPQKQPGMDGPLVARWPDRRGVSGQSASAGRSFVWIGIDPQKVALLYAGPPGADVATLSPGPMKAAAFWSGVLLSSQLCLSDPTLVPTTSEPDPGERPVLLLNDADIQDASGQSYAAGSTWLVIGLIVASVWGLIQASLSFAGAGNKP